MSPLASLLLLVGAFPTPDPAAPRPPPEPAPRATRPAPSAADVPAWIWDAEGSDVVWFRRRFQLDADLLEAQVLATADNDFQLYLDGARVLEGETWWQPARADLTAALADGGAHLLAVRAENHGGPAAFALELRLTHEDRTERLVTDQGWLCSTEGADGWELADHDDGSWHPATVLGRVGDLPWDDLDTQSWALSWLARAPRATPAEDLGVPDGFAVELLLSPPPELGSWVTLAWDDRGRMLVSDQYDRGLYRLTLPERRPTAQAPHAWADGPPRVERIDVDLSGANGLLWWDDALLVMVCDNGRHDSGLYRVSDGDGDDQLDTVELLVPLEGGGDHGWHALVPHPDGRSIVTVAGNRTTPGPITSSRVPLHWREDVLLPRLDDPTGFMADATPPAGCLYRIDPEGRTWELLSEGYRNPYDAAFHRSGDLFTFDADMEWDLNTPWYRPTRLCLVSSGSAYGWRSGSAKWPDHHLDGLPGVVEVGPGSPVGMTFGYGARFPARWAEALYLADWSYGTVHAVHLEPHGAAWRGEREAFLTGSPFPVTDLAVHPDDGALYLITGGRNTQTGVYRVSYVGDEPRAGDDAALARAGLGPRATTDGRSVSPEAGNATRDLRLTLEGFHGRADPKALAILWPALGHDDRFVRFAARVALEWQPVEGWWQAALEERDPSTALSALAALARTLGAAGPEPQLVAELAAALERMDWEGLRTERQLDWLRVHALTFARLGPPDAQAGQRLAARLSAAFPTGRAALDGALCELLAYLQAPGLAAAAVPRLGAAPTREEQLDLARSLRVLETGWTPELRRDYVVWLAQAERYGGGQSLAGFVRQIRDDALARMPPDAREAMVSLTEELLAADLGDPVPSLLAGRTELRDWTLDALDAAVAARRTGRDFDRGRALFGATDCFRCHRLAGEGGAVGPDLTTAGSRFSARELLDSILHPSATISDQYERTVITTRDGRVILGRIVNHNGHEIEVRTDMFRPGDVQRVDRRLVAGMEPSDVSAMPEGLLGLLTEDEVADLVAYVLSGGREDHPAFR